MISVSDKMHQLRMDLRAFSRDMDSLSPKTSLYQKLKIRCATIEQELVVLGAQKTHQSI